MSRTRYLKSALVGGAALALMASAAMAAEVQAFDVPAGDLGQALDAYARQSGVQIIYRVAEVSGVRTPGARGQLSSDEALTQLLAGTNFQIRRDPSGAIAIAQEGGSSPQSSGAGGDVDALIVTAQKREENIQDVPIAISAFSQEDLTTRQVAGGPDLMTQIPNFTFTKTNFTGYSIQIRGIGTQAVSATTDAAVAVAFNNTPFIRNRFFEQEFYDLQRVEVLRGPQGTLYGRNATAGVVNIISAKPKFFYEAKAAADVANYGSMRLEGMVNVPLVEDKVALRLAGAWTKRDGFVTNQITGGQIDGRDLWSTRLSLRFEPTDALRANFIWEHFEEDDDRLRSGKQLCKRHTPTEIGGVPLIQDSGSAGSKASTYSQGCMPTSLYSPEAFQTPNGFALPYYAPLDGIGLSVFSNIDPYVSVSQSRDLRVIESTREPEYQAKSDLAELQVEFDLSPSLTLASETAYSADALFSFQDFNRFNTKPGAFRVDRVPIADRRAGLFGPDGSFCDPQLGCSNRLVLADLSTGEARQFSQELRLSSDFDGPFNFSLGGNFLRYDMEDKYYVFINTLTLWAAQGTWSKRGITGLPGRTPYDTFLYPWVGGVSDNSECLRDRRPGNPLTLQQVTGAGCIYIDPNPIHSLNDKGHNYFLSKNPYRLISYAAFGEAYYEIAPDLKLTAGFRWTVDKKHAPRIPSWLIAADTVGYPVMEVVDQEWSEPTGRLAVDWKPDLGFTDDTLLYASYAHGYKAGGMNPPPAVIATYGNFEDDAKFLESVTVPKVFEAEFIDAFEVGTKNTLFDGRVTANLSAFYYDYKDYQISQILNRSAVNSNFDAEIWGAEIEIDWRPTENLRLGFKGGYQQTRVGDGEKAIDTMDRTGGGQVTYLPDGTEVQWVVTRPFPAIPSNCVMPLYMVTYGGQINVPFATGGADGPCVHAYVAGWDPMTKLPYVPNPPGLPGYPGFDPTTAPNNGEGFFTDLSGNELPNAPNFTGTLTADYTMPLRGDWLLTFHGDFYYQSEAWTRIFNMDGYDKLKAYTNVNLAAIFANEESGWNVMAYVKNVMDRDSITGAFLFSDDTGLTTNVFLNEPRLYGIRVTKQWDGDPIWGSLLRERNPDGRHAFTVELGGVVQRTQAQGAPFSPAYLDNFSAAIDPRPGQQGDLDWGDERQAGLSWRPAAGDWSVSAVVRYGRTNGRSETLSREVVGTSLNCPTCTPVILENYTVSSTTYRESHEIVDFTVGRDVRLGTLGEGLDSTWSLGARYADFRSDSQADISGIPDMYAHPTALLTNPTHQTQYVSTSSAERAFDGVGPVLTWEASAPLLGDGDTGRLALDWKVGGGVLFGKQKTTIQETGYSVYTFHAQGGKYQQFPTRTDLVPVNLSRSDDVTVPFVDLSLGLSYAIDRLKIGAGYRWERYFDAIDGGYSQAEEADRTIDGPYFKLSVGFGG